MTVNEYKETACATAGSIEDVEIEENVIPIPQQQEAENENLLGRVLAGEFCFYQSLCSFVIFDICLL